MEKDVIYNNIHKYTYIYKYEYKQVNKTCTLGV